MALKAIDHTLPIYYCYKPIFLEILARWITHTDEFEQEYKKSHPKMGNNIPGSIILLALSKLLQISHEYLNLFELFLSKYEFWSKIDTACTSELETILLAFYRLLKFDTHRFKPFVQPKNLYQIINKVESKFGVSKFYPFKSFLYIYSLQKYPKIK